MRERSQRKSPVTTQGSCNYVRWLCGLYRCHWYGLRRKPYQWQVKLALDNFHREQAITLLSVALWVTLTNGLQNLHPLHNATENTMCAVEVRCGSKSDEELRPVSVAPGIGHR